MSESSHSAVLDSALAGAPGPIAVRDGLTTENAEHPVGCPKCGSLESWGPSSWCPACGFYPRLGTSVGPAIPSAVAPAGELKRPPQSFAELWERMPSWARVLCFGIAAIIGASLAARVATAGSEFGRSLCGLLELAVGLAIFGTMHAVAAFKAMVRNHRLGIVDSLLHPYEVWQPTLEDLPHTARRVWLGAWGLTAAICAIVVVGGIRYSALLDDWGIRKRADLAGASRMEKKSVEGAATIEMLSHDCVVVGYNLSPADGSISELLLAALVGGEMKYVGSITEGIPPETNAELVWRLVDLKQPTPSVHCPGSGIWVKPIVACKVSFKSWTEDQRMSGATFEELLAETDTAN